MSCTGRSRQIFSGKEKGVHKDADTVGQPEKSRGESQGNHPAATVQKPQGAAATSPQAPLAAVYARADPAMDTETRDHGTYHSPSRGPTETKGSCLSKKPLGVSRHTNISTQPWTPRTTRTQAGRDTNHRQGHPQPGHRYRTHAPEPKYHESPPHRGTTTQVSSIHEKPIQPRSKHPLHPVPHHTARCGGRARSPRNATSASAHSGNRADTTKNHADNGTPVPTPRRGKLIQQEVPCQRHYPCSAPSPLSQSKCR
ncbi:hypothetical protein CRENBAI_006913 [Crenichthys baileyi]|uniref:Uncharacterized protein n=1 Tax=Crenichthys baileyi TaxID=28760 RepID=A0AAV9S7W2_9TELE